MRRVSTAMARQPETGQPAEVVRRRPYYTELVAYLATQANGATTDQLQQIPELDLAAGAEADGDPGRSARLAAEPLRQRDPDGSIEPDPRSSSLVDTRMVQIRDVRQLNLVRFLSCRSQQ